MHEKLIPLFPLQVVLFPRTPLPLHIFEDRYKEMISELLDSGGEFGVVLAQGSGILRIGCAAAIQTVTQRYEDGRLDIITVGRDRFQVVAIDTGRSFLRGRVTAFNDDDFSPSSFDALHRAVQANTEYRRRTESEEAPDLRDPQVSFQLAQVSPDIGFRQLLLVMRAEAERLGRVADHLEMLVERERLRDQARRASRTNGHTGHKFYIEGKG